MQGEHTRTMRQIEHQNKMLDSQIEHDEEMRRIKQRTEEYEEKIRRLKED